MAQLAISGAFVGSVVLGIIGAFQDQSPIIRSFPKNGKPVSGEYYVIQGQLQTNDPVVYGDKQYVRIRADTTLPVTLDGVDQISLGDNASMVEQKSKDQIVSIQGVDVTAFIDSFPEVIVHQDEQTTITGVPANYTSYQVTGKFQDGKLKEIINAKLRVVSRSKMSKRKSVFTALSNVLVTVAMTGLIAYVLYPKKD